MVLKVQFSDNLLLSGHWNEYPGVYCKSNIDTMGFQPFEETDMEEMQVACFRFTVRDDYHYNPWNTYIKHDLLL